jgi:integrase
MSGCALPGRRRRRCSGRCGTTRCRSWHGERIKRIARRRDDALSPEEVARLLDAAPRLKYKAALSVAYGAGLRAAEVISLKIADIDSKRMVIRVEQGKGRKDRYVMLSPHLLELLRAWWRAARPQGWFDMSSATRF